MVVDKALSKTINPMRLRFTIRDLLWSMIVIALTSIWFLEHKQLKETAAELSSARMRMGQLENLVLRNAQNLTGPQLTQQQRSDQVSGEDEEDVYAEKTTRHAVQIGVVQQNGNDRKSE